MGRYNEYYRLRAHARNMRESQVPATDSERAIPRTDRERTADLVHRAVPLLVQYALPIALPAKVPGRILRPVSTIKAAWIVWSQMTSGGDPSGYGSVDQSPILQEQALTEDGDFGSIGWINEDDAAIRFFDRPKPLATQELDDHNYKIVENRVRQILGHVGVNFDPIE